MLDYTIMIAHAAETAHESATTGGIGALGIDSTALIYQIINFALLFFLLKRYAFPPIIKLLEERRMRIEESLKMAGVIEQRNREISEKQTELFQSAQEESRRILADARAQSETLLKETEIKARDRAEQLTTDAKASIQAEIASLRRELGHETAQLIAQATERIIGQKLDPKLDEKLIQSAIKEVEEDKA